MIIICQFYKSEMNESDYEYDYEPVTNQTEAVLSVKNLHYLVSNITLDNIWFGII